MPKRTDISSILIIGAGPIVIGQAAEFDYSGTQAAKALKAEGYRIVLAQDFGDDWVHEVIAMTRPEVEIQFPVRAINEREIPLVYDDFR